MAKHVFAVKDVVIVLLRKRGEAMTKPKLVTLTLHIESQTTEEHLEAVTKAAFDLADRGRELFLAAGIASYHASFDIPETDPAAGRRADRASEAAEVLCDRWGRKRGGA